MSHIASPLPFPPQPPPPSAGAFWRGKKRCEIEGKNGAADDDAGRGRPSEADTPTLLTAAPLIYPGPDEKPLEDGADVKAVDAGGGVDQVAAALLD